LKYYISYWSEKGKRAENEDSYLVCKLQKGLILLAVADGMGGHSGGKIASNLAIKFLKEKSKKIWKKARYNLEEFKNSIPLIFEEINKEILKVSSENLELKDMGTTLVCVFIQKENIITANVGDSRAYLITRENIEKLTIDESVIADSLKRGIIKEEEVESSPYKNALFNFIGNENFTPPKIYPKENFFYKLPKDSAVLLTSDGVHNFLKEMAILNSLTYYKNLKESAKFLVNLALKKGSNDNLTAIIFKKGKFLTSKGKFLILLEKVLYFLLILLLILIFFISFKTYNYISAKEKFKPVYAKMEEIGEKKYKIVLLKSGKYKFIKGDKIDVGILRDGRFIVLSNGIIKNSNGEIECYIFQGIENIKKDKVYLIKRK